MARMLKWKNTVPKTKNGVTLPKTFKTLKATLLYICYQVVEGSVNPLIISQGTLANFRRKKYISEDCK
jgi:hypothetical protein